MPSHRFFALAGLIISNADKRLKRGGGGTAEHSLIGTSRNQDERFIRRVPALLAKEAQIWSRQSALASIENCWCRDGPVANREANLRPGNKLPGVNRSKCRLSSILRKHCQGMMYRPSETSSKAGRQCWGVLLYCSGSTTD